MFALPLVEFQFHIWSFGSLQNYQFHVVARLHIHIWQCIVRGVTSLWFPLRQRINGCAVGVSPQPSRGVWGHAPPEKFGVLDSLRPILVHSDGCFEVNFIKPVDNVIWLDTYVRPDFSAIIMVFTWQDNTEKQWHTGKSIGRETSVAWPCLHANRWAHIRIIWVYIRFKSSCPVQYICDEIANAWHALAHCCADRCPRHDHALRSRRDMIRVPRAFHCHTCTLRRT